MNVEKPILLQLALLQDQPNSLSPRIVQQILSHYELGQIHEIRAITNGLLNDNLYVRMDTGAYVLKYYRRTQREVTREHDVIHRLFDSGIQVVTPILNRRKKTYVTQNNRPAALFPFITGGFIGLA